VTPVVQTVDLRTVRPGRYSLVVKVTSAAGAEATRSATLYVIAPRAYRDADEVVARTLAVRAGPESAGPWPPPSRRDDRMSVDSAGGARRVALARLVTEDQGGDLPELEVGVSVTRRAGSRPESADVVWTVRGGGPDPRRMVIALQGDRRADLGTGARHESAGAGPVDEYRMPLGAWHVLLESSAAELYLEDIRFELKKKELRALAELMGLAGA
jgi:hypothetical protein